MKNRSLIERLRLRSTRKHGRLLVLTGARQTGKTTLARQAFPDRTCLSFEDPVLRSSLSKLSAADWVERYPHAILDEIQKAPGVVESIRAAHDSADNTRYLLLGSSQILLLSRVKDSLAGRAAIEELWPLTLPEMATDSWDDPVPESRLVRWLRSRPANKTILLGVPAADSGFSKAQVLLSRYLSIGGMPAVHDPDLSEDERESWLRDYQRTYLERDVADLAALRDLEPFVLAQKALALRAGRLLSFSDVARDASIAPATARRFLRYLELSYQVVLLRPFHSNRLKRLSQMPKVHFVDPGVQRSITGRRGSCTGEEFESAVVAEIFKQIRTAALPVEFLHLRTHDGREVDLLLETAAGFVAIEIKMSDRASDADARHLRGLEALLDKPLLMSFILSQDREVKSMGDGILALPAAWALSGSPG